MNVKATSLLGFNGAKRSGERSEDAAAVGRSDAVGMEVCGGFLPYFLDCLSFRIFRVKQQTAPEQNYPPGN